MIEKSLGWLAILAALCEQLILGGTAVGQTTAFQYQGFLNDGGAPATGSYDFQFSLYDALTNGDQIGPVLTNSATVVSNGIFNATLDFGNVFTGNNYWLQTAVETNGNGAFTFLTPRQAITSVPYAITAGNALALSGSLPATQISGTIPFNNLPASLITNGATGLNLTGTFIGSGSGLTNLPAASTLTGQLILQNGVSLNIQTNGANPFTATSWLGIEMPALTNSPSVAIYCGYPTNIPAFGYLNSMAGYVAVHEPSIPAQTEEIRLVTTILGNTLGLWMQDGSFWYAADTLPNVPQAWNYQQHPSLGDQMFYTFTWPNSGRHAIEIHLNAGSVVGLFVPATNSFVNTPQPKLTGVIVGDSITDGAAGYGGEQLWAAQLENLLLPYGINLIPQGEGGTGFAATNGPGLVSFLLRLTNNVAAFNPDFVIWAGGINDPTNLLYAAATNCFGQLQTLLPNCRQLAIAPWGDLIQGDEAASDQIFSNAAAVYQIPVIYPEYTSNAAWVTGNRSMPGSGTAPLYWSGDGPHPNALGHQFYGNQVAAFVLANLLPNAASVPW
jgi:lysophospholipase L1-like esterase